MSITITRPVRTVDVITDMSLMTQIIDLANQVNELQNSKPKNATEAETSAWRKQITGLQKTLREQVEKQDESTLQLTLRAVPASKWVMATTANTKVVNGQTIKDYAGILKTVLPLMAEKAVWKKTGETEDLGGTANIAEFVDSLLDTQQMDLITAAQELNSPVTSVPKAVLNLI